MPIPDIQFDANRTRGQGQEAVVRTARLAQRILMLAMLAIAVGYAFSNYTVLEANEQAFIVQFGKVRGDALSPGRGYYALPRPFASVVRVSTDRSRTVRAQFWYEGDASPGAMAPETLRTAQDRYLLTGDYNVVHARWNATFVIADLKRFYFGFSEGQAEQLISNSLANTVVKETAAISIEQAISRGSENLRLAVESSLKRKLAQLDTGVDVTSLRVYYEQREVPRQVVSSFREVIQAENDYSSTLSTAHAAARKMDQQAHGHAAQILAEAESYAKQTLAGIEADAEYFQKLLPTFRSSRSTLLVTMFQETLAQMIANAKDVYYVLPNQQVRLKLNRVPSPEPGSGKEEQHGH